MTIGPLKSIESLKSALRGEATHSQTRSLSDAQYSAGFEVFQRDLGWATYQDFIIPQLSELLGPLFNSRPHISVLEIGPGPKTVLQYLPSPMRHKVHRYDAFEPNRLFAATLEQSLDFPPKPNSPLPRLTTLPNIHRKPFAPESSTWDDNLIDNERFDVVLFCHSMYGMNPKAKFIRRALDRLVEQPDDGLVVVFHRQGSLQLDGLVCHRTASFPTGVISVINEDKVLDSFTRFIAGYSVKNEAEDNEVRSAWRYHCRNLGRQTPPNTLLFSSPEIMVAFSRHAMALPELTAQVPCVSGTKMVKNREARLYHATTMVKPTKVHHVQSCVQWALKHRVGLTVVGGGHSGQCLWPYVVSIDMGAFDQVHITTVEEENGGGSFIVAGGGCKTGDIVHAATAAGLTVPLGSRPSVGAGLWLQGGIGHLARLHGLTCDAIVGAVLVSVDSGQIVCVGRVPPQHCPAGSVRPEDEDGLLWAVKGAGSNFGIVISVTFKACKAPTFSVRNWVVDLHNDSEARLRLREFDESVAKKLDREWSADAYLYWDDAQLHLGMSLYEVAATKVALGTPKILGSSLQPGGEVDVVDSIGLFETEMYMSGMHGGHGGSKTSSFKRCLFLKDIGHAQIAPKLVTAFDTRPSEFCYFHLLQGGGAIRDFPPDATAFGCRDWDFACVVTGVWPRDQDGTATARAVVEWVYNIVNELLPVCVGVYGADLGPDPRDAALAAKAFGANTPRLARLKDRFDPHNILSYACPLPKAATEQGLQKVVILVTGESCAGKDYCAEIWASVFNSLSDRELRSRVVSISEATKREYAAATGADLDRLLRDRDYKEQHRAALTAYFHDQVQQWPRLPEEHFLDVVRGAKDVDVLFITGMRDEAPVATFSHLAADSKLIEVNVRANRGIRQARRGYQSNGVHYMNGDPNLVIGTSESMTLDYRPCFIFNNNPSGAQSARVFAAKCLLPFVHDDLRRLAHMVSSIPDFPGPGIEFRHVLDIVQQRGGLSLCTSLLKSHFRGDWTNVDAIVSCEAGGYVFASPLASMVNLPLALIREAGKLPPPTICVTKSPSHVSSLNNQREKRIEMSRDSVRRGAKVVVIDDVLATGRTLVAVLELLNEAGVRAEDVTVMVVAEFPAHRGRGLFRRTFGKVYVQSLLVFDGR